MRLLSRRQLRLLLPLGSALALSLTGDSTLYAVLANQTEVVGISLGAVGVMLGANRLIRIPGNLLAGSLYDRLSRRWLFLTGLALGIVSTASYSLVTGFWPLLATRLLWGCAWALINVGAYTMTFEWSTETDRGRMTGFLQVSYMLGLALSPILGGVLTDALGFRPAVRICALVSSLGLGAAVAALPEIRPQGSDTDPQPTQRLSLRTLYARLRHLDPRLLRISYVYLVLFFVSNGVLASTISLYLRQRWGAEFHIAGLVVGVSSLAGFLLALRSALGILGGPLAGTLSDRLGNRWPVAGGAVLVGVGGFVALVLGPGIWAVPTGVVLVSLCAGSLIAVVTAIVGDLTAGRRSGLSMGGMATAGDIGSATGPLFAYALAGALDLRWVYLACGLLLASCLVVLSTNRKTP
jgi:MFS family permease